MKKGTLAGAACAAFLAIPTALCAKSFTPNQGADSLAALAGTAFYGAFTALAVAITIGTARQSNNNNTPQP